MVRVDREWLVDQVVSLLERASRSSDPDHLACSKYCSLLKDLLPQHAGGVPDQQLQKIRSQVQSEMEQRRDELEP